MIVQAGTRWHRKRKQGHSDSVIVVKVTVSNVQFRERDLGSGYSRMPTAVFLGTYVPEHTRCQRCGSDEVRPGYRNCTKCTSLICAVQNKRKKGTTEDVLTTTDPTVIEQKRQDRAPTGPAQQPVGSVAPPQPVRVVVNGAQRWQVRGRRVIIQEETIEVEASSMIDVLAAVETQAPGLDVTDVHLLD